jgi:uncharacterized DUF497 family protein
MAFRWNDWNTDHVGQHGVDLHEAEKVVENAKPPYPLKREDDKWLVWSAGTGGRYLQVIFLLDEDDTIYIIHARPLTEREISRLRRRRKK